MNSISGDCQELKAQYDACFNGWFKDKFLKGITEDACSQLFFSYQQCVKKAIQEKNIDLKDVEADILGTINEKRLPKS